MFFLFIWKIDSVIYRLGERHETWNESLSISETFSKYGVSLPLYTPITGPVVCYGVGNTKRVPGECTAGVIF